MRKKHREKTQRPVYTFNDLMKVQKEAVLSVKLIGDETKQYTVRYQKWVKDVDLLENIVQELINSPNARYNISKKMLNQYVTQYRFVDLKKYFKPFLPKLTNKNMIQIYKDLMRKIHKRETKKQKIAETKGASGRIWNKFIHVITNLINTKPKWDHINHKYVSSTDHIYEYERKKGYNAYHVEQHRPASIIMKLLMQLHGDTNYCECHKQWKNISTLIKELKEEVKTIQESLKTMPILISRYGKEPIIDFLIKSRAKIMKDKRKNLRPYIVGTSSQPL